MASTRLRKTFNYPTESEDDDAVEEGMDEKDQETVLTTLQTKDTSSTRLYTQLLLVLPLAPTLLYIPRLFSGLGGFVGSLFAIASLLSTAYTLYYLPLPPVRIRVTTVGKESDEGERRGGRRSEGKPAAKRRSMPRSATGFSSAPPPKHDAPVVPYMSEETTEVLKTYIIPVNMAICTVFAVHELYQSRSWSEGMIIGGGYVPGFVLGIIMCARRELRVVDLGELERLRYREKGT